MKKDIDEIIASRKEDFGEYTVWTVDRQRPGMESAKEWGIVGVPTLLLVAEREEIGRIIGSARRVVLEQAIERCLQPDIFSEQPDRSKLPRGFVLRDFGEPTDDGTRSSENRDS